MVLWLASCSVSCNTACDGCATLDQVDHLLKEPLMLFFCMHPSVRLYPIQVLIVFIYLMVSYTTMYVLNSHYLLMFIR
jgi:hypothetical protein